MSVHIVNDKIKVTRFAKMKAEGEKIVCLTAYDYTSAKIIDAAGVEIILVGDSLGMVMNGYGSTLPVTVDDIIYHTKAVIRGASRSFIVADMPFGSYHAGDDDALKNCIRVIKEAGADAIKLEGGSEIAPLIKRLLSAGINVMGHIGLKPQMINTMGGYKIFGRDGSDALIDDAKALSDAGAFAIVVEGVVAGAAESVTKNVNIPTIGIGAGLGCDGQILVFHDVFGLYTDFKPKFVKQYANLADIITKSTKEYISDVKSGSFPDDKHSF